MKLKLNGLMVSVDEGEIARMVQERITSRSSNSAIFTPPRIGEEWEEQGGVYAGVARGKNGAPDYYLILATHCDAESVKWDEAKTWAENVSSGDEGLHDYTLPARHEQALLFANVPEHFQKEYYWSSEQHASSSYYAWFQTFVNGDQPDDLLKGYSYRARAVRRLDIK